MQLFFVNLGYSVTFLSLQPSNVPGRRFEQMERMKAKKFLAGTILVVLTAFIAGCHQTSDGYRGYSRGYGTYRDGTYRDGTYRDGFRDGRVYERRTDDRYGRYRDYHRDGWYR
jgi:hypothetical protein